MTRFSRWLQVVMAAGLLGTAFQPGAGCLSRVAQNVNPCGTILNCDPLEYDLLWYDPQKDFPDFNTDPTCTIPGFCDPVPFPPAGPGSNVTGTGAADNTSTSTTTTGTNLFGFVPFQ